jgi:methionyl-tRNA formyltransferase
MMRVAILAPISNSLYSRLTAHLAAMEPGIEIVLIVVRTPWTLKRIRSEFRQDTGGLLAKVRTKLIIGEENLDTASCDTLAGLARQSGLGSGDLRAFAVERRIPFMRVPDYNGPPALQALRDARPDAVAFTGGGIIRKGLLAIPRLGILNSHCGILPFYRGTDVVEWPAAEGRLGEPGIGLTLHLMDEGLDTGPILLCRRMTLQGGDTFGSIRERIGPAHVHLMLDGLRGLRDGTIKPVPQARGAGRQYFVMHPRLLDFASAQLARALPDRTVADLPGAKLDGKEVE